jgi:hypothetical protein
MNIDDGRVLASSGAMLADGEFQFEGADASEFVRPAGAMVTIRTSLAALGTEFALVGDARRDVDGLWSADRPLHSLTLLTTVPPLDQLLDFPSFALSSDGVASHRVRFELSAEHSDFARVVVDAVGGDESRRDALVGGARSMTIEVKRSPDAFEFALEARVAEPKKRDGTSGAPFTARVRAKLSFATMALAGSRLWWLGGAERWAVPAEEQSGSLAQVLTLDRAGGTPYFRGALDLGVGQSVYTRGPWVKAWVAEHRLRLTPHRELRRSMGFVEGNNYGPDLVFDNLGTAAWKEMLADADEAVLEQSGAGIGHVQGVTGRDVGDCGPHIQPISAVRIRLSRSEEGLRITFDGTLGEIRQTPSQPVLGPEFHGDFLVPTAFLFARGILLRDQWAERQRMLGKI